MPKKYKVVSTAALKPGVTAEAATQALRKLGVADAHIAVLLKQKIVAKQDLDYDKALAFSEKLSRSGLILSIQSYDVAAEPAVLQEQQVLQQTLKQIEDAFAEPFPAMPVTGRYRRSLLAVTLASLVGPVIYFGLLIGVASSLWWYFAAGHHQWFGEYHRSALMGPKMWLLSYALPAFVGFILLVFLLYPLWPRGRRQEPLILERRKHPHIYAVVEQMTAAIGVPAPVHIELVADVNAAAGPVQGMSSLLRGQLKLVVGMSLVAGSNVQQLLGILGHEFGHFAQRNAMIAYVWINKINHWLGECAFGQDALHEKLNTWMAKYDNNLAQACLYAAHFMLFLMRHLFALLYRLNLRLTLAMSRQMEFDADRYEARIVGSAAFRAGTMNLRKLSHAWGEISEANISAYQQKQRLLGDMPAAVQRVAGQLPARAITDIENSLHDETTQFWDSHPADIERIDHAERAQEPGRLRNEQPASILFGDFKALCERVTRYYYYDRGIQKAGDYIADDAELLTMRSQPVSGTAAGMS